MTRAFGWAALTAAWAALAGGCGVNRCKEHTVLLGISFTGAAAGADHVDVAASDAGNDHTGSFRRTPGARVDTVEIDFPEGYPVGQAVTVVIDATEVGTRVGHKTVKLTPTGTCDRFDVILDGLGGDDAGMPDIGSAEASVGDALAALDGAADLAVSLGDGGGGGGDLAGVPLDLSGAVFDLAADLATNGAIDCPLPGDPRIAMQAPFATVPLNGASFFGGAATAWNWSITTAHPCATLGGFSGFKLTNSGLQNASAQFFVSGDFQVTLTVTAGGVPQMCSWTQHVGQPGLRVELCWDNSGTADLDLHLHKPGTTKPWFDTNDDCFYQNCAASAFGSPANWGYASGPLAECLAANGGWSSVGHCPNPRLDLDNISTVGQPEADSVDSPREGEVFRAMVHYFGNSSGSVPEHPIVVVYCDGAAVGVFGQSPQILSGFSTPGASMNGPMWRVADITSHGGDGGVTCTAQELHTDGGTFLITNNSTVY